MDIKTSKNENRTNEIIVEPKSRNTNITIEEDTINNSKPLKLNTYSKRQRNRLRKRKRKKKMHHKEKQDIVICKSNDVCELPPMKKLKLETKQKLLGQLVNLVNRKIS
eukprot:TRINITY_DN7777_c0_g1_i1.p2 TRINITY_DN7777_c0_g1~~TRINITY_DN7777_c0_g1_i1.p2  ORF type:complete len:108 (-),score=23.86 TRINITY_DN7777_c0_g1_i1:105-428(-)